MRSPSVSAAYPNSAVTAADAAAIIEAFASGTPESVPRSAPSAAAIAHATPTLTRPRSTRDKRARLPQRSCLMNANTMPSGVAANVGIATSATKNAERWRRSATEKAMPNTRCDGTIARRSARKMARSSPSARKNRTTSAIPKKRTETP